MNAKHQFKYTYNDTDLEEYSPVEVTFEIPATATIPQMLRNFEQYLRACGYVFDGALDVVPDGYDIKDEFDGSLYEFEDEEPQGGCMADFDKVCNCPVGPKGEEGPVGKASDLLNEWNEGIAKLDKEQKKSIWKKVWKQAGLK